MTGARLGHTARERRLPAVLAALVLVLGLAAGLAVHADAKKKGGGKAKVFNGQVSPNAAVPDPAPATIAPPLTSTITVPKKFKGRVVGDLNVVGIQTTGSAPGAANDLVAYLTAPNGKTVDLFQNIGLGTTQSIGPLTIDDDTKTSLCNLPPATPCVDPTQTLYAPFAGTTNTVYNSSGGYPTSGPLATFDGAPMKGTWTLSVIDLGPPGAGNGTNLLNGWGLQITPKKPVT